MQNEGDAEIVYLKHSSQSKSVLLAFFIPDVAYIYWKTTGYKFIRKKILMLVIPRPLISFKLFDLL